MTRDPARPVPTWRRLPRWSGLLVLLPAAAAVCVLHGVPGTERGEAPPPAAGAPAATEAPPVRKVRLPQPKDGAPLGEISIPRLAELGYPARFPVAQGIDKARVLNDGAVGHYPDTELPGEEGNFGLAGHRNLHGEPFRHLDELRVGDEVVVRTASAAYHYVLDRQLPQTDADNYSVLDPIPPESGYRSPGRYITLTTCTPEFTSDYRLIWWGHLARRVPLTDDTPHLEDR
ncbi:MULTISPECIES: class E sortase [Streptomyces]|uniref:Class E sortase n=1 Tax=Streptomyces solicathayae TaxID=3081768 RepID=A0ABZ0M0T3_9ACTN|nr:class E sortase [Streptomyces sp. HUAS YS2]WOX24688.1 class E sortase [Streptomyces sp. HUAS YS2]